MWRTHRSAGSASLLIAVLLIGAAAYTVVTSRADARDSLRDSFRQRAAVLGETVADALLNVEDDTAPFVGPSERLAAPIRAVQRAQPVPRVMVADAGGRILAASPKSLVEANLTSVSSNWLSALRGGHSTVSDVTRVGNVPAFDLIAPFESSTGESRLLLTTLPIALLQAQTEGLVRSSVGTRGGAGFIVDGRNRVVTTTTKLPAGSLRPPPGKQDVVVDTPLADLGWRVVLQVPGDRLYASVDGSAATVGWALLAGFVVAVLALLALGATTLRRSAQLAHQRLHDPLTGLPNRSVLVERAARLEGSMTALFIDLDRFKPVNDEFGHDVGDCVLQAIATRLRVATRPDDVISRMGGDEFLVLCRSLSVEDADALAARIEQHISEPLDLKGHRLTVGCSIGIAVLEGGADVNELIRQADEAMYAVKHTRSHAHMTASHHS